MSSPHVAGIAALIQSINPTWSPQQVRAAICGTARSVPELGEIIMHGGIANAHEALLVSNFHLFTLDFNDGISAPFTDYVVPGSKHLEPRYWPKKEGHVFIGWYTSAADGSLFDFNTEINQDITIYAQWDVAIPGTFVTEFPDDNFRRYILNLLNARDDGNRTSLDMIDGNDFTFLSGINYLNVDGSSIRDMTGIQHFIGLQQLSCDSNMLTELDVSTILGLKVLSCATNRLTILNISNNPGLISLTCHNSRLTTLDVSNSPELQELYCQANGLTTLDVSNNTALELLYCNYNELTTLDLSNCPKLTRISCHYNQLTTLNASNIPKLSSLFCYANQLTTLDVSNNPELTMLECYDNQLTALDVSNNPKLRNIFCEDNQLTTLNVSSNPALLNLFCYNNRLTTLDVSNNPELKQLYCNDNQLTELITNNPKLVVIHCQWNQLTSLDLSNLPELTVLYCGNNQLTMLNVSSNPAIYSINCQVNQLTTLDISNNPSLLVLRCFDNQLTSLDLSNNPRLFWVFCYNNRLTTLDVSNCSRLESLFCNNNQLTSLDISDNPSLENLDCYGNQLTELDVSNNPRLSDLSCFENRLTTLDVSNNPELIFMLCGLNEITTLDISNNPKLIWLHCQDNYMASPDNVIGWQNLFNEPGTTWDDRFWFYPQRTESMPTPTPALDGIEAFVTRTYQNVLERDPDPEGFKHWVNGLGSGHLTAGDIIDQFFFSNEFVRKNVTDEKFITIAFHTFMDRPPGEEGFAFWVDHVLASGYSRWYVLHSMMKSIEFISICQLYGIPIGVLPPERADNTVNVVAFVTRMYQYVLLREPEPEGLEHWKNGLLNGNLTSADLIDEFFFSTEFMEKNVTDVEFIEIAFNTFMNRPPGEEGITFWVDYVLASGYSHRYVLGSMMKSDEFIAICKLYGITVGEFSDEWIADEDGIFTQMDTAPVDDVEIMETDQGEPKENEPEEAETIETDETDLHGPEQGDTKQDEPERSEEAEEVETE